MVVDMELENAKQMVLNIMKEKDEIDAKLRECQNVLNANHVGMDEPLIDSEGYPRNDIDVYQVRHVRHQIIYLQNDFKKLMKKIEEGLNTVHAIAAGRPRNSEAEVVVTISDEPDTATPSTYMTMNTDQNTRDVIDVDVDIHTEPFLKVNLVSPSSPAESAGIKLDDLIIEFGSINAQNFRALKDIGDLVEQSRYKEIIVKVKRTDKTTELLKLIPRPWTGRGLLGCNVNVIEIVER